MIRATIDLEHMASFLLLFCRVGGVVTAAPLIGSARAPARLKAALAAVISVALLPAAASAGPLSGPVAMAIAAAGEILLGLAIGFGASLIFAAVQMAGEMADMQSAFGFAGVVSPQTGEWNAVIGQVHMSVAWLIFLGADGHHVVLDGLGASLTAAPLGGGPGVAAPELIGAVGATMAAAVRIAAPVIGAVLLADFALGLLTRAAPQMNLFAIGFPVKLAVGLGMAMISLPALVGIEHWLIGAARDLIYSILAAR